MARTHSWSRISTLLAAAATCLQRLPAAAAQVVEGAFIIKLSPEIGTGAGLFARDADQHELFHKRAANTLLDYSVRHEFKDHPDIYLGLSIDVAVEARKDTLEDTIDMLKAIPGVVEVAPVYEVHIPDHPINETVPTTHSLTAYKGDFTLEKAPEGRSILDTPLRMSGVDKVHAMGIKGKGVKVGIIDTGIDHRHPALGAGFGPGKKVAGGYSWINDKGNLVESKDPLATCFGGGHGTHVAGIVGMNPLDSPEGFPVSGVAPEAEIYMYRIFDCNLFAPGVDFIMAAMMKGIEDKVDMLSLSLSIGSPPATGLGDPLADIVKKMTDAGVAVIVAMANDAGPSPFARNIYTQEFPSTEPTAIGVGAVSNADYPLVYNAMDSVGATIQYASIWPINDRELEVVTVSNGCLPAAWRTAVTSLSEARLNNTIFAFEVTESCRAPDGANAAIRTLPPFILGYSAASKNPYANPYNLPPQSRLNMTQFIQLDVDDADKLKAGIAKGGKYTIKFSARGQFSSAPQSNVGGLMDYYSSFGPVRLTYDMKPQISAPGGNILATYPLGTLGGYSILSGTSMATPFLAGCYALIKSKFPKATISEILTMMQTTAKPMAWVFDKEILSATAQQGAGLVDVYRAITAQTAVSPGQMLITDNDKKVYGAANITIRNKGDAAKTYKLSHRGAGYMNQLLEINEYNQKAVYGTAEFESDTVVVGAGESRTVSLRIVPPSRSVLPERLPVFGGFVRVTEQGGAGEEFSVPYSGPPYSLYRTNSIARTRAAAGTDAEASLPEVVFYYQNGSYVSVAELLVVNNSMRFASDATFNLWTTAYRVDVVPANTTIRPTHYGFDNTSSSGLVVGGGSGGVAGGAATRETDYRPAAAPPKTSFVGFPSYGTLRNVSGLLSPSNNFSPTGRGGLEVVGDDRRTSRLGPGDYRWLLSVMRWGGDKNVLEDWETWLSGVIRLVDGPAY